MNEHIIIENYRDDKKLRESFFRFVQQIFPSANFKIWFEKGFWPAEYIPYSIIKNDKIISNVSITKMKLIIDGKYLNGIQFGTVGTLPEFRKKGLSKFLMDYVLDLYKDKIDFYFLFANETVLDFYPKFGFRKCKDVIYKSDTNIPESNFAAKQLDVNNDSDLELIFRLLRNRIEITKLFGAAEYENITMWHILNIYPQKLFYLEEEDIIVIHSEKETELHVWDVISKKSFEIHTVLSKVIKGSEIKSIYYYFPPDQINFSYNKIFEDIDSNLFIRGEIYMDESKIKFPVTALT